MCASFKINKVRTEQINRSIESHMCDCPDCQRYYRYIKQLPPPAKAFFEETGTDPVKCQELWAYFPSDNGYTHYSGFFFIAVKPSALSGRLTLTKDWKTLNFGSCTFRVRLEYTSDKKSIMGFEADLPV